ncbi:MAG: hypothetical protein SPD80_00115 [Atopobium sp.]|uniref:hypothetical protein n=1 Tax=Atopobium sp. TaxID=1872650 RepID=UPI002A7EACBE|nr:hypothetical protein [Atopobium sp.]MDY4521980.1 hypothetical protein [Atopobium sp.]
MTIAQFALEMGCNEAIGSKVMLSWYFYEVFIPYRMAYLTKATIIRYKSCFRKDIALRFGDYELGDIPHVQIQTWINHMTYAKAKRCITTLKATHETLLQHAGIANTVNAAIHGHSELSSVGYKHYLVPGEGTVTPASQAMGALIYKELA